CHSYIRSPFTF
nr:immunoglobulin light chain junction region [Macaca mulatta]MOX49262.1 immunoglobulin light chain junction region [Macaca mulatta]MOX49283.1 immunoglobulin light chain junction region [Macaca mulatta]MOX50088.1 immunoglobulin light chain junction region [Macaca mulatta]MOX50933.1 immunoglobulin light chain junction region [Macaca mulatta]